jgi:hypothetical protein
MTVVCCSISGLYFSSTARWSIVQPFLFAFLAFLPPSDDRSQVELSDGPCSSAHSPGQSHTSESILVWEHMRTVLRQGSDVILCAKWLSITLMER